MSCLSLALTRHFVITILIWSWNNIFVSGNSKDSWVSTTEGEPNEETNDELPATTEHHAEIQVGHPNPLYGMQ